MAHPYKCRPCSLAPELSPSDMLHYKYQLALDGHGPSYDATIWKLLSNSAVFFVHDDYRRTHLWNMYYYPFLSPGKHYFPSSVSEVVKDIEWCLANDAFCADMAEAARGAVQCLLRFEVLVEYYRLLLQLLHDWENK